MNNNLGLTLDSKQSLELQELAQQLIHCAALARQFGMYGALSYYGPIEDKTFQVGIRMMTTGRLSEEIDSALRLISNELSTGFPQIRANMIADVLRHIYCGESMDAVLKTLNGYCAKGESFGPPQWQTKFPEIEAFREAISGYSEEHPINEAELKRILSELGLEKTGIQTRESFLATEIDN